VQRHDLDQELDHTKLTFTTDNNSQPTPKTTNPPDLGPFAKIPSLTPRTENTIAMAPNVDIYDDVNVLLLQRALKDSLESDA
jgi:hypothetical protein